MPIIPLPWDILALSRLPADQQETAVRKRRLVIREHRDAKGDNRCHITDWLIEDFLNDTPPRPHPTPKEIMKQCMNFYEWCRTVLIDPTPPDAILDPALWDEDLSTPGFDMLSELFKIQQAAKLFRDTTVYARRTVADYRRLYSVLPEKIPADFRLPSIPDFLGTATPNAGCQNFIASHASCGAYCNLHQWGPCRPPQPTPAL
jgi:hypothetical protein